jgi:hypothetical protein
VYFPKYGWVEFEPTVSQAPILRPLGAIFDTNSSQQVPTPAPTLPSEINDPALQDKPDTNLSDANSSPGWLFVAWLSIPVVILILAFVGWKVSQRFSLPPFAIMAERGLRRVGLTPPEALQTWARLAALSTIEKAYQEVNDALRRLQVAPLPADTPTDRVAQLKNILPEVADSASALLVEYLASAYGSKSGNPGLAQEAGYSIRNLSWKRMLFLRFNGGLTQEKQERYAGWRT